MSAPEQVNLDAYPLNHRPEYPWPESEHGYMLAVEIEARAEALYENESPGELHELTPWHHLPTAERMEWRGRAYVEARAEVYP